MAFKFNPFTGNFDQINDTPVFNVNTTSGTANLTANLTYVVDTSGGAATLTMPTPTANAYVIIKDNGNAEANNITINPNSGEDIDGESSLVISSDNGSTILVADGTDWYST